MLAGWSSGSKYPLLGSVRASAQMVCYEAALGLSVAAVILVAGTLSTSGIVAGAEHGVRNWNLVATGVPAVRRLPDRRHRRAEPAAVRPRRGRAGARRRVPHRVLLDPLRALLPRRVHEHGHDVGHHRHPVLRRPAAGRGNDMPDHSRARSTGMVWFFLKLFVFLFMYVWFRATLPRLRYDQLMDLGWKLLIPLALGWFLLPRRAAASAEDQGWNSRRGSAVGRRRRRGACAAYGLFMAALPGQRPPTRAAKGRCSDGLPRRLPRHRCARSAAQQGHHAVLGRTGRRCRATRRCPSPSALHGRHVLNRYEDGMEKCIGCELCAGVCPAQCIYVRGADNPPDDPVSPGRALRLRLRDQLPALHPLRPVRGGLPDRGDHRERSCSSSPSPTGATRSTRRTSCSSTTTASPSSCRGRTGARATTSTPRAGCGPPRRPATPSFEGVVGWSGELGYGVRGPSRAAEATTADVEPRPRRGRSTPDGGHH